MLAENLVSTALILDPRRVAAVRGLEIKQGAMQRLSDRLLLLLDQEVVEQQ